MYIGRLFYPVLSLGYGKRIGIWFCGCNRDCMGCSSPELKNQTSENNISIEAIFNILEDIIKEADGVTISGGEPFEQSKDLRKLIEWLRNKGLDDILVYSGYTLNELKEKEDEDVWYCLNNIAALIDGPYEQLLDDGKGIRGSSNQNVYIYKYYDRHKRILTVDRKQQCIKLENKLIFIGLPKEK